MDLFTNINFSIAKTASNETQLIDLNYELEMNTTLAILTYAIFNQSSSADIVEIKLWFVGNINSEGLVDDESNRHHIPLNSIWNKVTIKIPIYNTGQIYTGLCLQEIKDTWNYEVCEF